jgi:hypothetical protein
MKVIALLPVRNEAWVLPHSLACLSRFCDVVLVSDQQSTDASLHIYRQFPKVVVVGGTPGGGAASSESLPVRVRWRLLDAARDYAGQNLLWSSDADELCSPKIVAAFLDGQADRFRPRTFIECRYYNLWYGQTTFRDDFSPYRPQRKIVAFVDDRIVDFDRSATVRPLHEPRVPRETSGTKVESDIPVLHLQWLLPDRNQMKQAWYRCVELLDGRETAADINANYAITLPTPFVRASRVPAEWVEGVSFPDFTTDLETTWQEREVLSWFDRHGIETFEPLEIWHVKRLGDEFRRRTGRRPRPHRSDPRAWPLRARDLGRRAASAAWRRIFA